MEIVEFGKENPEIILLLHGGGLSWWNYKDVSAILSKKYHIVIPLLEVTAILRLLKMLQPDSANTSAKSTAGRYLQEGDYLLAVRSLWKCFLLRLIFSAMQSLKAHW